MFKKIIIPLVIFGLTFFIGLYEGKTAAAQCYDGASCIQCGPPAAPGLLCQNGCYSAADCACEYPGCGSAAY